MRGRLLIGLGNPLAGDDGFGPAVMARLLEEGDLPDDVDVVSSCTDLLGHLDAFPRYASVVLVDAVLGADRRAGEVEVLTEEALAGWEARSTSAHLLSPVEALRVFRALAPAAATRLVLIALHTDAVGPEPVHARAAGIEAGARLVRAVLVDSRP